MNAQDVAMNTPRKKWNSFFFYTWINNIRFVSVCSSSCVQTVDCGRYEFAFKFFLLHSSILYVFSDFCEEEFLFRFRLILEFFTEWERYSWFNSHTHDFLWSQWLCYDLNLMQMKCEWLPVVHCRQSNIIISSSGQSFLGALLSVIMQKWWLHSSSVIRMRNIHVSAHHIGLPLPIHLTIFLQS